MHTIKCDTPKGMHITKACEVAVNMARKARCRVAFTFNDVPLIAEPTTNAKRLVNEWHDRFDAMRAAAA